MDEKATPETAQQQQSSAPAKDRMHHGTKVSWLTSGHTDRGHGVTISDEDPDGNIIVAVHDMFGEHNPGYHPVIYCAVTWLTPDPAPAAEGKAS